MTAELPRQPAQNRQDTQHRKLVLQGETEQQSHSVQEQQQEPQLQESSSQELSRMAQEGTEVELISSREWEEVVVRKSWAATLISMVTISLFFVVFILFHMFATGLLSTLFLDIEVVLLSSILTAILSIVAFIGVLTYLVYILVFLRKFLQERVIIKSGKYRKVGNFVHRNTGNFLIKTVGIRSRTAVYSADTFIRVEQRRSPLGRIFNYGTAAFIANSSLYPDQPSIFVANLYKLTDQLELMQEVIDSAHGEDNQLPV